MKTLMKFSAVFVVAMVCGSAAADYLYSMVKDAYYYYNGENPTFNYFTVKGKYNDNTYTDALPIYMQQEGGVSTTQFPSDVTGHSSSGAPNDGFFVKFNGDATSYQTFLFEMFNDNDGSPERVAWQEFINADLAGHVFSGDLDKVEATPLVISRVVPEPTSALLSLFGLAALALRRRKMA